jgi:hypothetical protein
MTTSLFSSARRNVDCSSKHLLELKGLKGEVRLFSPNKGAARSRYLSGVSRNLVVATSDLESPLKRSWNILECGGPVANVMAGQKNGLEIEPCRRYLTRTMIWIVLCLQGNTSTI